MFALLNYSSLSHVILALSSAVTNLPNKTLIFHDLQGPTIEFHDFLGLENQISRLSRLSMDSTNPDKTWKLLHVDFESSLKQELSNNVALDSNFHKQG